MKNVLRIADIPMKCYPDYSFLLSIILNDSANLDWFYCNYIQLYFDETDFFNPLRVFYADINGDIWNVRNPRLNFEVLHIGMIKSLNLDLICLLKNAIERSRYIIISADEYYIEDRWAYKRMHYGHVQLVYGYDDEKNAFSILGMNTEHKLSSQLLSYEDMKCAYEHVQEEIYDQNNVVKLISLKHNVNDEYEFNIQTIIDQFDQYLYCKDSSQKFSNYFNIKSFYYGIDVYEPAKRYISAIGQNEYKWNVSKIASVINEHKNIMVQRLLFIQKKGYLKDGDSLIEEYKSIRDISDETKLLMMMYAQSHKKRLLTSVLVNIDRIKQKEIQVIPKIISMLKTELEQENKFYSNHQYISHSRLNDSFYTLSRSYKSVLNAKFFINHKTIFRDLCISFISSSIVITNRDLMPVSIMINHNGIVECTNGNNVIQIGKLENFDEDRIEVKLQVLLPEKKVHILVSDSCGNSIKKENLEYNSRSLSFEEIDTMSILSGGIKPICVESLSIEGE